MGSCCVLALWHWYCDSVRFHELSQKEMDELSVSETEWERRRGIVGVLRGAARTYSRAQNDGDDILLFNNLTSWSRIINPMYRIIHWANTEHSPEHECSESTYQCIRGTNCSICYPKHISHSMASHYWRTTFGIGLVSSSSGMTLWVNALASRKTICIKIYGWRTHARVGLTFKYGTPFQGARPRVSQPNNPRISPRKVYA